MCDNVKCYECDEKAEYYYQGLSYCEDCILNKFNINVVEIGKCYNCGEYCNPDLVVVHNNKVFCSCECAFANLGCERI